MQFSSDSGGVLATPPPTAQSRRRAGGGDQQSRTSTSRRRYSSPRRYCSSYARTTSPGGRSSGGSTFWLLSAVFFVALSTVLLYSSCANAMDKEWHRERDRDRRYRQQLRRRQHLYAEGSHYHNHPKNLMGAAPNDNTDEQVQQAPAVQFEQAQTSTTEEPIEVRPEDDIMGDGDDVQLPADIGQQRAGSDISSQVASSPLAPPQLTQKDDAREERLSPWSPLSWKRKFTSFFSGIGDKNKRVAAAGSESGGNYLAEGADYANLTDAEREARFLNLFTVVRFNNTSCIGDTGDNGTCYTANECYRLGGVVGGSCAGSFGVCCIFIKTCGQNSSANCTYFVNQGYPGSVSQSGSCQLAINKCAPNVCQLRLDFLQFEIGGPSNDVTNAPTTVGQCLNDQFIVTASGGSVTPVICGINTGHHMYVDVSNLNQASVLTFVTSPNLAGVSNRNWKVKITQIRCGAEYAAVSGCLQYYTGVVGRFSSFNYDSAQGVQLANQDYSFCVRMEAGFCGIKYSQCTDNINTPTQSFSVTGNAAPGAGLGSSTSDNCANGQDKDWVTIPCGSSQSFNIQNAQPNTFCPDRFCGNVLNPVNGQNVAAQIYSSRKPFVVYYHTDGTELGSTNNRGFCLDYVQQPCSPNSG